MRNSLFVAFGATLASLLIGVGLAAMIARKRFWGRRIPLQIIAFGAGVPPLFAGLGVRFGLDRRFGVSWSEDRAAVLIALISLYIIIGLYAVLSAAIAGFESVESNAIDAARLAGASRFSIARSLLWPVARPRAACACAGVFTLAMFDPCGPLMLGARRTLGFQLLDLAGAAIRAHAPPRSRFAAGSAWRSPSVSSVVGAARPARIGARDVFRCREEYKSGSR